MVTQVLDNTKIDVAEFIKQNVTPYYGDDSFLSGPTQRTLYMWSKVSELMKEERKTLVNNSKSFFRQLKEIFNFKQKGLADDSSVIGEFGMSKVVPKVYDKIKRKGITTVDYLYKKSK